MKAIDRFDPELGTAFTSYAVPTMLGELKRHFRDNGWGLRVPRGTQERALRVSQAAYELAGRLGRSPSVAELAEAIEASTEQVLEAMEAGAAYEPVSLDSAPPGDDGDPGGTYSERVGAEDIRYEFVEYGAAIATTVRELSERERVILYLRFVDDFTQSEIAERIGVSQMHISRLIRRALAKLRTAAEAEPRTLARAA
jgi:RNA polymerase sigma-B factor